MRIKKWVPWVAPGLGVLVLDQAVKRLHLGLSQAGTGARTVRNTGMAFGLFQGNAYAILAVSALLVAMGFFLVRGMRVSGLAPIALSMILGGALGNMIDRLIYGYVIDMFPFFGWFVFNVADAGVVVGAVLCGWSLLFRPQDWSKKEQ